MAHDLGRFTYSTLAAQIGCPTSAITAQVTRLVQKGALRREGKEFVVAQPVEVSA